jgi:hypothetical protein
MLATTSVLCGSGCILWVTDVIFRSRTNEEVQFKLVEDTIRHVQDRKVCVALFADPRKA